MKFTKMHGLGNDYVYVDLFTQRIGNAGKLSTAISNRHTGVGSDGLILIAPSRTCDVRMEMYNSDGSRAQMCGNGIRCVAKYAVEHELAGGPEMTIETDAGVKRAQCRIERGRVIAVRIDMGEPGLAPAALPCTLPGERIVNHPVEIGGQAYRITCVSMGNPHAVVFVENPADLDLSLIGPRFEHAPIFPQRTNTHFVRVDSATHVTMRTWERGAGATQACGTGACAVAVAASLNGLTRRAITATLPGGDLELEWADDGRVYMTGPAVEVFSGDWPDDGAGSTAP